MIEESKVISTSRPGLEFRIKDFAKTERAVIQCVATSWAVIAIKITLAKTYAYPICDEFSESTTEKSGKFKDLIFKGK